jgi:hypothetical protein
MFPRAGSDVPVAARLAKSRRMADGQRDDADASCDPARRLQPQPSSCSDSRPLVVESVSRGQAAPLAASSQNKAGMCFRISRLRTAGPFRRPMSRSAAGYFQALRVRAPRGWGYFQNKPGISFRVIAKRLRVLSEAGFGLAGPGLHQLSGDESCSNSLNTGHPRPQGLESLHVR